MGVTCGNCSTRDQVVKHESADDVRACYAGKYRAGLARPTQASSDGATPGRERRTDRAVFAEIPVGEAGYGYFALADATDPDRVRFYRVSRPRRGKYVGWTFVDAQASGDFYPIRGAPGREVLTRIAAAHPAAAALYGSKMGRCSSCHRPLTDQVSRDQGYGPDCWAKLASGAA